jgi:CHASE3 domain sensor protein
MAFSDLNVGKRMGAGFGTVLLLMLITGVVTFWSLGTVDSDVRKVAEEDLPFTLKAHRL